MLHIRLAMQLPCHLRGIQLLSIFELHDLLFSIGNVNDIIYLFLFVMLICAVTNVFSVNGQWLFNMFVSCLRSSKCFIHLKKKCSSYFLVEILGLAWGVTGLKGIAWVPWSQSGVVTEKETTLKLQKQSVECGLVYRVFYFRYFWFVNICTACSLGALFLSQFFWLCLGLLKLKGMMRRLSTFLQLIHETNMNANQVCVCLSFACRFLNCIISLCPAV